MTLKDREYKKLDEQFNCKLTDQERQNIAEYKAMVEHWKYQIKINKCLKKIHNKGEGV